MEILIKIGDSGGYQDGQIIAVKPDGWFIPALDMKAWIDEGKEPVVLADMPEYQVNRLKRRVSKMRWHLAHTVAEIMTEFHMKELIAEGDKALAERDHDRMVTLGLDTNWGYEDLKVHFALRVAKASDHDYVELVDRNQGTDHIARITDKRRYRAEYETRFDEGALVAIRNKATRVEVDRTTEMPGTVVKPTSAKEVR